MGEFICDLLKVFIFVLVRRKRFRRKFGFQRQDVAVNRETPLWFDVRGVYVIVRRERRGTGGVYNIFY